MASKLPKCYGLLFDKSVPDCQACLVQNKCARAVNDQENIAEEPSDISTIPNEKRLIILAICKKYDISTSYTSRKTKTVCDITKENYKEFFNLDFLLTTKEALVKLLRIK